MKKLVPFILLLSLIGTSLFSLSGCAEEEEDLSVKIQEKIVAYRTDLEDSAATLTSDEAIRDYLLSWAKQKGINCTTDSSQNVIMSVKSSKEYKEANPTVILCSYDAKQFEDCIIPMACALYLAKNNENTGKLRIIFTNDSGHSYDGIKALSKNYFTDNTSVFCLNYSDRNMWSTNTGGRSTYCFTTKVSYTEPSNDKAYRIKIGGLPGGIPSSRISSYPNAIKELGNLLAYFKTNALIYELSKVSGGSNANTYPKSVSATIVIDEDDTDKFEARMETAIENFNDDYLEDYPEATYTYEEVDLPKRVMTEESLNDTISLLYTLIDGVYYKDEDDNLISISSIGSMKEKDGVYTISATANSLSESVLSEIDNQYQIICGLANANYKKVSSQDGWQSDADSDFARAIIKAFRDYANAQMEFKDCVPSTNTSYVYEKNKNCNIINISFNEDKLERYTGTILTFLLNQPHTEESES
ncbi:hypothetical protein D1155_05260 [Anaerotruncus sp. 80]|uniref:Uncharacterized protein n=1 Tax=Anaerotruncus colihominis TaxID=169435 RepID=A0A845QHT3_9FIRM|nr:MULTISPECIES: aminoacyl-histidine dipeptidase [Anaerotruncus]NBH61056.1 hypothetical protein [Anaerotruncus colihominis]NCF01711.1 hypothetical protein [Anaerotruncus sp. 80]